MQCSQTILKEKYFANKNKTVLYPFAAQSPPAGSACAPSSPSPPSSAAAGHSSGAPPYGPKSVIPCSSAHHFLHLQKVRKSPMFVFQSHPLYTSSPPPSTAFALAAAASES